MHQFQINHRLRPDKISIIKHISKSLQIQNFCKKYQITGTCQNNQAFKTPWRVQHILRGWDLPAESLTFDWKLAGARFSSQYFPITSTSWESGDFSVLTSMPSHSFSIFCDQTNMCERLITFVIHLMLNKNVNTIKDCWSQHLQKVLGKENVPFCFLESMQNDLHWCAWLLPCLTDRG